MKNSRGEVARMSLARSLSILGLSVAMSSAAMASNYKSLHAKALDLAIAGNTKASLVVLRGLEKDKLPEDQMAQVQLSIGRVLYQNGDYTGAVNEYRKIATGSDAWFQSLEERAWAYMQLGKPDDALAQLKTVLSPLFKERATSEAFFLSALAHLRICDYPALFKDLDTFKSRYRERVKTWTASASFDAGAARQLKETTESIQKLNIVEAEAIQRLYLDDEELKKKVAKPARIAKRSDDLSFPISADDDKEVWLDEVDNYQVRVTGCPTDNVSTQASAQTKSAGRDKGHSL